MKPHDWSRGAIEHRRPEQPWPRGARPVVEAAQDLARERLGLNVPLHLPRAGDFHLVAEIPEAHADAATGLALLLSRRLPGLWLTLDRLFVRDGRFHRRQRRFGLRLVEAKGVCLTRDVRAALRDVL
jgi:hypothetical protein